ncbi:MAG TPA: pitrilysin family protein, partial [Verrucomicrobiae bacterium]|nr:pitrilysin family protein [Verrucomicrobiae bacterium]
ERGAIEQEVAQDLSNPEYNFYTKLLAALFKGTPYEVDALGTRPSFDKTTGAMLKQFHDDWYVPNNAVLVIAGDVQPKAALEEVKKLFGDIPAKELPPRPEFHFEAVKPDVLKMNTDLPYGMIAIAFRFPGTDSRDNAAVQVMADVLASQRGRLYGLVPEGKALFADFSYDTLQRAGLGYAVAGFPAEGDAKALLDQVREIIQIESTNNFSTELVEAAKRREMTRFELQKNSISGLAMAWSQAVAIEGRQSIEDDINAIKQVTVDDVNRVARQYLNTNEALQAVLTPESSGNAVSSKGFGGVESFAPKQASNEKLPSCAQKVMEHMQVPRSMLKPEDIKLSNGLRLIIQPENISDTVSIFGRVRSNPDMQTPKGQEGVDSVLDQLFTFGTESLDRLAFQKALDQIGAVESAGTSFSMQVLSEDFERGAELLADNQLSPALPEEAFRIIQPQLAAAVAGELLSPGYRESRALKLALFPKGDPTHREATPKTVQALSTPDVHRYYEHVFRPDLTTIVVMGKVTPEKAKAVIAKYFGKWTATGPKPKTVPPAVPPNSPSTSVVPDASRVQDKVTLAQTMGLTRTNDDFYAFELGNHVLGGAFYATRLYHDLRQENGLVYFVDSSLQAGLLRSVYSVQYACDPPNVAKARAIVMHNLNLMRTNDVSAGELRQAKLLLLRENTLAESSVERIANGWLSRSTSDLPLDEPTRAAHRYIKLTADDVRNTFAKWLRPDDFVEIVLGPNPK